MRIKIIDASWIADKSLDRYAESVILSEDYTNVKIVKNPSLHVQSSVSKIFSEITDLAINEYKSKYEKIIFVVSCFPIMRIERIPILTRYICKNSGYLHSHGISSSQFLEFYEKFVQLKCSCGDFTAEGNVVWLKSKFASVDEWNSAIVKRFGQTICDFSKSYPFSNNPNFISSLDFNRNGAVKLDEFRLFKLMSYVNRI